MNAKIICENISKAEIEKAFSLGEYQKGDFDIFPIKYKMYRRGDKILIEFEEEFSFCELIFVMVDLFEVTRETNRNAQGFVNTNKSNKITEYLNGERVCFYLSEDLKIGLKENEDNYLDMLDLVTESNKNYSIDIDSFLSYTSANKRKFEEPNTRSFNYELIEEGEYLYKKGDYENEYLEDLKKKGNKA